MCVNPSMPSNNTQWCSDKLHDLLGFADTALAKYLVSVAKKARNHAEIVAVLRDGGVTAGPGQQESFAKQLLNRVQTKPTDRDNQSAAPQTRKTNADWVKDASQYELVDMKDELSRAAKKQKKENFMNMEKH